MQRALHAMRTICKWQSCARYRRRSRRRTGVLSRHPSTSLRACKVRMVVARCPPRLAARRRKSERSSFIRMAPYAFSTSIARRATNCCDWCPSAPFAPPPSVACQLGALGTLWAWPLRAWCSRRQSCPHVTFRLSAQSHVRTLALARRHDSVLTLGIVCHRRLTRAPPHAQWTTVHHDGTISEVFGTAAVDALPRPTAQAGDGPVRRLDNWAPRVNRHNRRCSIM